MAEEPIKRKRGRPPKAKEQTAEAPVKKTETAPAEQPKKKIGRPKLTEEEKARRKALGIKGKPAGPLAALDKALEPGDNTRLISKNLEVMMLPKVNLQDPEAVRDRIRQYFEILAKYDSRPTISGFSMAFGMDRFRMHQVIYNTNSNTRVTFYKTVPEESRAVLREVYQFMETMWEDYMLTGKINPVTGIFLAKNNFGYRDQTEHVITPNQQQEGPNADQIRRRYIGDVIREEEERRALEEGEDR